MEIRLLTYLSPGLPIALFGAVADHLRRCPDLAGCGITLASEEGISGPDSGLVARSEDPFSRGEADVGFVCAWTYQGLHGRQRPPAELLGVAPVFEDERARGRPVYFCDVVVRRDSPAGSFWDLEGGAWAYNDTSSLSGYGALVDKLGSPDRVEAFFRRTVQSGSHPESIRLVADGKADAASIDSNALRGLFEQVPDLGDEVRVLESWGPYPTQPVVVRSNLDQDLKAALRESLLGIEADPVTSSEIAPFGLKRFAAVGEEDYDAGRIPRPLPLRRSPALGGTDAG